MGKLEEFPIKFKGVSGIAQWNNRQNKFMF